ncbi:hypothetical protein DPMN_179130 [Dreissena polymorpha]|uniref:Uncharacterized protein n=1 Tax=Dreissena polymorpha TaxID=45954 RepID=A0A9D4IM25_DREPO|nr:hypothetical protein DPMN_179130 [Dreissena polymorpha]
MEVSQDESEFHIDLSYEKKRNERLRKQRQHKLSLVRKQFIGKLSQKMRFFTSQKLNQRDKAQPRTARKSEAQPEAGGDPGMQNNAAPTQGGNM